MQRNLDRDILMDIHDDLQDYELDVEILIAGTDRTGSHIYVIDDPGQDFCFDSMGFYSGGSEDIHARALFSYQRYSKEIELNRAIFSVFEAKKRAESASGVGVLILQ